MYKKKGEKLGYYQFYDTNLILHRSGTPEWDAIFNGGISVDSNDGILGNGATVTIEYDKSAWGNSVIEFKQSKYDTVDADYSIRIGDNWRVVLSPERTGDVSFTEWLLSSDCPLRNYPITITLTYDFTK